MTIATRVNGHKLLSNNVEMLFEDIENLLKGKDCNQSEKMIKTGNIVNTNMTINEKLEEIKLMSRILDEMLESKLGAKEWLEKYDISKGNLYDN